MTPTLIRSHRKGGVDTSGVVDVSTPPLINRDTRAIPERAERAVR